MEKNDEEYIEVNVGKGIRNSYEMKRFFKKLNTLGSVGEQRSYSLLHYKTLR